MPPKFPAIARGQNIDSPGNDDRHDRPDSNRGGSPRELRAGKEKVPPAKRGGFGQQGRDPVYIKAQMGGARSGSDNPAGRGGFSGEARGGNFTPEKRVSGHGGSATNRGGAGSGANFGNNGQSNLPTYGNSNPKPSSGNTSGRSYKLIAGRFKRAAMGAKASQGGSYGAPPVSSNT